MLAAVGEPRGDLPEPIRRGAFREAQRRQLLVLVGELPLPLFLDQVEVADMHGSAGAGMR